MTTKRPNIKKLLAALKYYADPANYRTERGWRQWRGRKRVENDGGERARKALALR